METLTRIGHETRAKPLAPAAQARRQESQGLHVCLAKKNAQLQGLLHAYLCQLRGSGESSDGIKTRTKYS